MLSMVECIVSHKEGKITRSIILHGIHVRDWSVVGHFTCSSLFDFILSECSLSDMHVYIVETVLFRFTMKTFVEFPHCKQHC